MPACEVCGQPATPGGIPGPDNPDTVCPTCEAQWDEPRDPLMGTTPNRGNNKAPRRL